jgi:predicted Zn-ribbon and HTH transcriptional regulator
MAEEKKVTENKEVTKNVEEAKENYVDERIKTVTNDATEAINSIVKVVELLDKENKEEVLNQIAAVLGKLEVLVAKDPTLQAVPVGVREEVVDFPGTVEDVELAKTEVVALIKKGEVALARDIMLNLASELDIYITALPIGTYPVVMKAIVPLVEEGKFKEAKALLVEALETLIIEKVVIPLPILRAEKTVIKASELTKDDDKANKDELSKLLAYAKEQLLLAQALGYGKIETDYKELFEEISNIESKLKGEEGTKGIFENLKTKLSAFMSGFNKVKTPTKMPQSENKEENNSN